MAFFKIGHLSPNL
ncbi:hypothetical protein Zm00014a_022179 [Zea mays]|uniref:Uncharacterized protein n=1 Tax=Zea mays TaxID=4577 RepID=A0A3L6EJI1_MAIZE|nr:hypothetical protein Zm00014a_022179 [Zea mays]